MTDTHCIAVSFDPEVHAADNRRLKVGYTWRKKFGCMEVPEVKCLKILEEENGRLERLLAEAMLDK